MYPGSFMTFYLVTVAGEKEKWSFILWFHPEEVFQISPVQVFTHQPPSRKIRDQIRSRVLHPLCHRRNETGTNNSINRVYSCEYIIRWRDGDLNPQHGLMKHASLSSPQNSRCDLKINDKTSSCTRFLWILVTFQLK